MPNAVSLALAPFPVLSRSHPIPDTDHPITHSNTHANHHTANTTRGVLFVHKQTLMRSRSLSHTHRVYKSRT